MAYIPQEKLAFSCHLADHCNLRCKGCDNYSPAAPARFTNHEVFRRDLVRIREIFGNRVSSIQLLGGEPLLNPEIDRFLITARQIFTEADQTEISIVTNGVLLNAMPDHFWQTCREQAVVVRYTWYPIPVDYEAAVKKGSRFSVPVERYGRPGEEGKTLQFDPLRSDGKSGWRVEFPQLLPRQQVHSGAGGTDLHMQYPGFCRYFLQRFRHWNGTESAGQPGPTAGSHIGTGDGVFVQAHSLLPVLQHPPPG